MAEWVMGLISVLLCLFEGYCIQSFWQVCRAKAVQDKECGMGGGHCMDCDKGIQ